MLASSSSSGSTPNRTSGSPPPAGPSRIRARPRRPSATWNRSPSPIRLTRRRILTAAGLDEIDFTDVHEPVYYGPDAATAYENVLRLLHARDLLDRLDATAAENARHRLRATLDAHDTGSGVLFDARAWIITARHPQTPLSPR